MIKKEVPGLNHTIHATSTWLRDVADEIGQPDAQVAYHALRGVLFAVRDRLTVDEAMDLAAQLPALVRGVYFEGYRPSGKPLTYRDRDTFLHQVTEELQASPSGASAEEAARAVFVVLNKHISAGEIQDVRRMLPKDIRNLWPKPQEASTETPR